MSETASSLVRSRTLFLARDEVVAAVEAEDLVDDKAKVDDCGGNVVGDDTNAAVEHVATATIRATSLYFTIVFFCYWFRLYEEKTR